MSSVYSLGKCAKTELLITDGIGTISEPLKTVYEQGNINLTGNVKYNDVSSGNVRFEIDTDGVLKQTGLTKLYVGGNIDTGVNQFSTGLNTSQDYIIRNPITGKDNITINHTTGQITFDPPLVVPTVPIEPLTLGTSGNLSGGTVVYDGITPQSFTVSDNGTFLNTPNTLVQRDSSGNFVAGTITASLSGNSTTSTTAVNINGGVSGNIPVQSGSSTTTFISNGSLGQVLTAQGGTTLPIWTTQSVVNDGTLAINNGTHMTGSGSFTANQAGNTSITIGTDATDANTPSTIVSRDSGGNFSAGTITGSLSGNSTTATTAVNLNGGSAGVIPYQSASGATSFSAVGTVGQVLTSGGTGVPTWTSTALPSDATITIATNNHLSGGSSFTLDQTTNQTITLTSDATPSNTPSTIVARGTAGEFTSGVITSPEMTSFGDLTFNAGALNLIQMLKPVNFNNNDLTNALSITGMNNTIFPVSASGTGSLQLKTNGSSRLTITSGGASTFSGTLSLNSSLIDGASSAGASGNLLTSTGSGITWVAPSSITVGTATNIAGGSQYAFPYQSGTGATDFLGAGTAGSFLTTNSTTSIPSWTAPSGITVGKADTIYVINNSSLGDYQIPCLTTTHTANNYYSLKVDGNTSIFTYNTNTHTLKPTNINLSGTFADSAGLVGTTGDILTSTTSGTSWVAPSTITAGSATNVEITDNNANSPFYIPFVSNNTGSLPLYVDKTTNPFTFNPSTGTMSLGGVSTTTTLSPSQIVIANIGATSTMTSVALTTRTINTPATVDLTLNGTSGNINLQTNGTTNTKITSTGLQLVDNNNNNTGLSSTYFSTGSVNYMNILPPVFTASLTSRFLNIGAYTNSSATLTKQPFGRIDTYGATNRLYTSATDTTPLTTTGTDTTKTIQLDTSSGNTLTIKTSNPTYSANYSSLELSSSAVGEPLVKLNSFRGASQYDLTGVQFQPNNGAIYNQYSSGEGITESGSQYTSSANMYYNPDNTTISSLNLFRITDTSFIWGTSSLGGSGANNVIGAITARMTFNNTLLTFGADDVGIQNRTTSTSITPGNPLTFTSTVSFKNYQINYSGTTGIPISSYSLNIPVNCDYNIAVYNGSTVSQTFASTATYRFNGGVTFTVPTLRYANINVKRLSVNATTITFLTGTLY